MKSMKGNDTMIKKGQVEMKSSSAPYVDQLIQAPLAFPTFSPLKLYIENDGDIISVQSNLFFLINHLAKMSEAGA
ncbi:hypothetical protein [Paenibacillus naphthalenovorans]|uniref:hypothetical protein n=1 Tax=Paenibacillus naphthalenovorans TaxID=162209 RepID=UPI003D28CFE9